MQKHRKASNYIVTFQRVYVCVVVVVCYLASWVVVRKKEASIAVRACLLVVSSPCSSLIHPFTFLSWSSPKRRVRTTTSRSFFPFLSLACLLPGYHRCRGIDICNTTLEKPILRSLHHALQVPSLLPVVLGVHRASRGLHVVVIENLRVHHYLPRIDW